MSARSPLSRRAGISIALAAAAAALAMRASTACDVTTDLALGAPSVPSAATLDLLRSTPARVTLFYAANDEVLPLVRRYFEGAAAAVPGLEVAILDHARHPASARELSVGENGEIAIEVETDAPSPRHDVIRIGVEREGARVRLRELDAAVREALSRLLRPAALVAIVTGHGELSEARGLGAAIRLFRSAGIDVRTAAIEDLGDLALAHPRMVALIAGPQSPLAPAEADALAGFVQQGGRALVAIDPDAPHGLAPAIARLGIDVGEGVVTSERNHLRSSGDATDRALLRGEPFGVHPSVASATESAIGPIVLRASPLSVREPEGVEATPTVWSPEGSFVDLDGDLARGAAEAEGRFALVIASRVPRSEGEGRAIVIGDADTISDRLLARGGSSLVLADGVRWLLGDEEAPARAISAIDAPLAITHEEERIAFVVHAGLVPGACVLVALAMARRRRR